MTVTYLRDTAIQAGLKTAVLDVEGIGWHAGRRAFTDLRERPIEVLFKLYPWEWMLREPFGRHLPVAPTRWLEPPWKMVLSNKAILAVLSELFPESPYLLRADFEPIGDTYVSKPLHSREGANVSIVQGGRVVAETGGEYGDGPADLPGVPAAARFRRPVRRRRELDGQRPRLRDGDPRGRRADHPEHQPVRAPHLPQVGPGQAADHGAGEIGRPRAWSVEQDDPLWDRWLDR